MRCSLPRKWKLWLRPRSTRILLTASGWNRAGDAIGIVGFTLAACARIHGLKVTAIVSDHLPDGKLQPLLAGGIEVLTESAARKALGSDGSPTHLASLMGQKDGWTFDLSHGSP